MSLIDRVNLIRWSEINSVEIYEDKFILKYIKVINKLIRRIPKLDRATILSLKDLYDNCYPSAFPPLLRRKEFNNIINEIAAKDFLNLHLFKKFLIDSAVMFHKKICRVSIYYMLCAMDDFEINPCRENTKFMKHQYDKIKKLNLFTDDELSDVITSAQYGDFEPFYEMRKIITDKFKDKNTLNLQRIQI